MATFSAVLYLSNIPGFDLNWEVVDPLVDIFAGWWRFGKFFNCCKFCYY